MDFIQTVNKQVDKFGPGKHGFSAGDPATGVLATFLSPTWCDNVQQEIINVIEAAGIEPSAASQVQLLAAIRESAKAQFLGGLSANNYVQLPNGLIFQWGVLNTQAPLNTPMNQGFSLSLTFPIAFSTGCYHISGSGIDTTALEGSEFSVGFASPSATGSTAFLYRVSGANTTAENMAVHWFAIGK